MVLSSAPIRKLVVKSTTKMTLNERFTALRHQKSPPPPKRTPKASLYVPVRGQGATRSSSHLKRSVAMEAALKIKKKSLKQRLGEKPLFSPVRPRSRFKIQTFRGTFSRGRGVSYRGRRFRAGFRGNSSGRASRRGRQTPRRTQRPLQRPPPPSKDELDAQLDTYMSSTKSLLDDASMEL